MGSRCTKHRREINITDVTECRPGGNKSHNNAADDKLSVSDSHMSQTLKPSSSHEPPVILNEVTADSTDLHPTIDHITDSPDQTIEIKEEEVTGCPANSTDLDTSIDHITDSPDQTIEIKEEEVTGCPANSTDLDTSIDHITDSPDQTIEIKEEEVTGCPSISTHLDTTIDHITESPDQILNITDKAKVTKCWSLIEQYVAAHGVVEAKRPDLGWKTVRLFVSSTFTDFFYEREILIKKVFPELREWCEERKLFLVECDLRWGVPRDSTTRDTLSTCMEEVDRCHGDNEGQPFFLNMLSHRYGWVPTMDDIPGDIVSRYSWVPGVSITTMEILHAAYRRNNPNAVFFIRRPEFLDRIPSQLEYQYTDSSRLAQLHLKTLKEKLKDKFPKQTYEYGCDVVEREDSTPAAPQIKIQGLEEFAQHSLDFFKTAIEGMYPHHDDAASLSELQLEGVLQQMFVEQKAERLVGRHGELELLMNYASGQQLDAFETIAGTGNDSYKRPQGVEDGNLNLLLDGDSGEGKSTLLAKFVFSAKQGGLNVFYHFVGISANSVSSTFILRRLLTTLLHGTDEETTIPDNLQDLGELLTKTLESTALQGRQLLVVIDGIEEILVREVISNLLWIPSSFPGNIRCVLSLGENANARALLEQAPALRLSLVQMSDEELQRIIEQTLAQYNKRLDPEQLRLLMNKPGHTSPLWLTLICEELRVFGRFEKVTERVVSLADTLPGLLGDIISRLLEEDETGCMKAALCLIHCCIQGFPVSESLNLLGNHETATPAPPIHWAKVRRLLKPYLRTSVVKNEERIFCFHKAMEKAVGEKLLKEGEDQKWLLIIVQYLETRCENTKLIHSDLLDFYSKNKLVDRMITFVRTNRKSWNISETIVRMHIQKFRCFVRMNDVQAVTLGLCMGCRIRPGSLSVRTSKNTEACVVCAAWIPSNFKSADAKLCMNHSLRLRHPPGLAMCYICKMPVAGQLVSLKICGQCSFGTQRCCYVGVS